MLAKNNIKNYACAVVKKQNIDNKCLNICPNLSETMVEQRNNSLMHTRRDQKSERMKIIQQNLHMTN